MQLKQGGDSGRKCRVSSAGFLEPGDEQIAPSRQQGTRPRLDQGASHVAPVKSGVHAHGEGERVIVPHSRSLLLPGRER